MGHKDCLLRDLPNWLAIASLRYPDDPDSIEQLSRLTTFQKDQLIAKDLVAEMELTPKERKLMDDVFIGIMPTGLMNAQNIKTSEGNTIIALHSGLLETVDTISRYLPVQIKADLSTKMFPDNDILLLNYLCAIGQLWMPELQNLQYDITALSRLPEASWKRVDMLMKTALAFILGHEIFHLVNDQEYSEVMSENHTLEFDADFYGLNHAAKVFWKASAVEDGLSLELTTYALLGPYVALATEAIAAKTNSKNHPPSKNRLEQIDKVLLDAFMRTAKNVQVTKKFENLLVGVKQVGSMFVASHVRYRTILDDMDHRMMYRTVPTSVHSLYGIPPSALYSSIISFSSEATLADVAAVKEGLKDMDLKHDEMYPPQP